MILKNSSNGSFVKGENRTFVRSEFLSIELSFPLNCGKISRQ